MHTLAYCQSTSTVYALAACHCTSPRSGWLSACSMTCYASSGRGSWSGQLTTVTWPPWSFCGTCVSVLTWRWRLLQAASLKHFSGHGREASSWMRGYAALQHRAGTCRRCGGRGATDAHGIYEHAAVQPRMGTWLYWNGRGSKAARGIGAITNQHHVQGQLIPGPNGPTGLQPQTTYSTVNPAS